LAAVIGLSLALSGCGRKTNAVKIDTGMAEEPVDSGGRDAKAESVEEEVKRLSGLWLLSRQEDRDGSVTVRGLTSGFLFEEDKVTDVRAFLAPKGINGDDFMTKGGSGSYKLDVSKTPKTIDVRWRDGTQLGIYKLEKDALTISWSESGKKERPQELNRDKADVKYYVRADRDKYRDRVGQKK
jgi:uncharacterized protein (TIGR03067 family)